MTKTINDPLLMAAKLFLAFIMGVCAFATFFLVIGAVAAPLVQDTLGAAIVAEGKGPLPDGFVWAMSALLLGVAAMLGLLIYFLLLLWRIIDSVGQGDPFVPKNADRLSCMGWVAVSGNVIALLMHGLVIWVADIARDLGEDVRFDEDLSFAGGGLLMILVLFILARVFRHGAAMREDLEGTV